MAQIHKLKVATKIRCSPDQFYGVIRNDMAQLAKIFPQIYKSIEILEGDGKSVGSVILLKYMTGGPNVVVAKEKVVAVDDKNRSMSFKVIEGDLMISFKSFVLKVHITANGQGGQVTWSIEYEKATKDVPHPNAYTDLLDKVTEGLDAHLLLNA